MNLIKAKEIISKKIQEAFLLDDILPDLRDEFVSLSDCQNNSEEIVAEEEFEKLMEMVV